MDYEKMTEKNKKIGWRTQKTFEQLGGETSHH
jgi:hypothetical protein